MAKKKQKIVGYTDSPNDVGYLQMNLTPPLPSAKKKAIHPGQRKTNEAADEKEVTDDSSTEMKLDDQGELKPVEKISKKEREDREKLEELTHKTTRILFRLSSAFPFQLFPDEITIEETKVNIAFREFFFAKQIRSANIKDISHVEVETSLFFSTLKIAAKSFIENYIKVEYLRTNQAIRARRIIEGLKTIAEEDIDTSNLSSQEILSKAEDLGKAQGLE